MKSWNYSIEFFYELYSLNDINNFIKMPVGGDDRGKGICTSIKWGSRWKGYMWHYSED